MSSCILDACSICSSTKEMPGSSSPYSCGPHSVSSLSSSSVCWASSMVLKHIRPLHVWKPKKKKICYSLQAILAWYIKLHEDNGDRRRVNEFIQHIYHFQELHEIFHWHTKLRRIAVPVRDSCRLEHFHITLLWGTARKTHFCYPDRAGSLWFKVCVLQAGSRTQLS